MKPIQILTAESIKNIKLVLEFVERWNKQDAEKEVAIAHHELEVLVAELEEELTNK